MVLLENLWKEVTCGNESNLRYLQRGVTAKMLFASVFPSVIFSILIASELANFLDF